MKTFKYILLLYLLAIQSTVLLVAQNTMQQPADLGNKAFAFSYTDTKNTVNYTNDFQGRTSNDVFYKFTLVRAMDISIDHCGSGVSDTYLHVLNAAGQAIYSNDDDWEYQYCENLYNSYLYISSLPAGTYYVVSEGYSQNGNITTTIQGISPYSEIGSSMATPVQLGSKTYSFEYSDTKNTADYVNNFQGQSSNDVFYKFTLTSTMDVSIDHCGSEVYDTYLHVLDASGEEIYSNDDDWEYEYCDNPTNSYLYIYSLAAGTYYVVSESFYESENGNITTSIRGIRPLPPTGLYDGSAVTGAANAGTNYILSITPTLATSDVRGLGVNESLQTVQYIDGLGRPVQTVQRGITPTKQDLATLTEYDGAGCEWKQWLPIPSTGNGAIVPTANFTNVSSLYSTEGRPYTEAIIEPSPLNRILGNKGPGSAWEDKPTTISYQTNDSSVAYFHVDNNGNLKREGNYAQATLYKTVSKDEDERTVEEYKDKLGQMILKRSKDDGQNIDTYFVNNDLGQLAYVIPPIAADSLPVSGIIYDTHGVLKRYAYLYKYDSRGNCTEKRLPGCGSIFMVYDMADRLVLSQDSVQRAKTTKEWTVTKYDIFGRVLYTGITQNQTSHTLLITELSSLLVTDSVASSGTGFMETGYTCTNYDPISLLTVNYYDNYAFVNLLTGTTKTNLTYAEKSGYDKAYSATPLWGTVEGCKGLLTGTKIYTLGGTINDKSITAMYYDYRGRVVQTRATNHLGGTDIAYNQYNFSGQVEKNLKEHTANGQSPITELYTNDYDHAGRLKTTYYKINTKEPVLLVNNTYDELGRLIQKKRHNDTDTEEFDYNIRNWTTRLKSGDFEEKLYYTSNPANSTPCFNGNISYMTWTYPNINTIKGYVFNYDNLNRLMYSINTNANHQQEGLNSEGFSYDKMGNVKGLWRTSNGGDIDNLDLRYIGNQLKSVYDDAGNSNLYNTKEYRDKVNVDIEMAYDANGNMIKDLDRDIVTIRYNLLNLPEIIQFKNGNQIKNTYDAGGQKLQTRNYTVVDYTLQPIVAENTIRDVMLSEEVYVDGTDYVGNIEYKYEASYYSGELSEEHAYLSHLYNLEGYNEDVNYQIFSYFRRDHLGNNREVWRAAWSPGYGNYAATTIQRTQYYPSGLPWASNSGDNPWMQNKKYNGKEFVEMHGLDEYDYHARSMYPALGDRFMSVDPLCEKYYSFSPYAYCGGNPVNFIDPDGRKRMKFALSFSLNSGYIGATAKILGFGAGLVSAPWGGVKQEISIYVCWDTDKKKAGIGVSHTSTDSKISNEGNLIVNGSYSKEKKTTMDANTIDGSSTKKDASHVEKETSGVGPIKNVSNNENETTVEASTSLSANALMVGVEVKQSFTIEPEPKPEKEPQVQPVLK